jgi:site-specific DNA-methyltransferase (adenine-specific)
VLPLGIDECRVPGQTYTQEEWNSKGSTGGGGHVRMGQAASEKTKEAYRNGLIPAPTGRWPANVTHDGSPEVMEAFAAFGERSGDRPRRKPRVANGYGANFMDDDWQGRDTETSGYADSGTAARFFYAAKASKRERGEGNVHPTVKPLALMSWLVKLACPPGGVVLDPFAGSGTTGVACVQTGRRFIGVEMDAGYHEIAQRRIAAARAELPLLAAIKGD